uniref:Uncharacterized protein n=1 Tax=Romanomermis culicivorax TaxID=13658 RepID=A0A915KGL9_ROMCU
MMRFTSSLEGLDLYNNEHSSPALFDLILNQCPNLRYFSVDFMNSKLMRKLALKAPNLQYLQ